MPAIKIVSNFLPAIVVLLLANVQLATTNVVHLKLKDYCEELSKTSQCHCSELYELEITCDAGETGPLLTIRIRYDNYVQIDCHQKDPRDFSILPNITIGNIPTVHFNDCSLPPLQPIQVILQRLRITKVKALFYVNAQLGGSLQRFHFNGLEGINHLKLSSNELTTLPKDTFQDLKNLTRLDLRSNKIQIHGDIFAALENLDFLELGQNNLQYLPAGLLRNQRKLNRLNLWGNSLTDLTKSDFQGLSSLTELDLSANKIETFQSDVFSLLTDLRSINLDANHIKSLPEGLFSENKNLTKFRLINNRVQLKRLPNGLLSNLPNLKEVRLSCGLENISPDTFTRSTEIRNLTISGNNLTKLPYLLFAHQFSLIDLDLSKNQLTELPDDIFQNTRNLVVLRLTDNWLENISSSIFTSMRNLEYLYMEHNNLLNIHTDAFNFNRKLIYINMEGNHLRLHHSVAKPREQFEIKSPLRHLNRLKILNLRNNSIGDIFHDWQRSLPELEFLDLSYNNFSNIAIGNLLYVSNKIIVDLSHNRIQTIDFDGITNVGYKTQKTIVILGHNPVHCDCRLFPFVEFLNGNIGTHLRAMIKTPTDDLVCNMPKRLNHRPVTQLLPEELLCPLDDDEPNTLKQCPIGCGCWIRSSDSTRIMNCSNGEFTNIPTIPKFWPHFWNQTELYVENNKIKQLPPAQMDPEYWLVNKLYAANNSITTLSVDNLPRDIQFLNVSHNKLQGLNTRFLQALNRTKTKIALSYNPWLCDCTLESLVLFAQTNYELIRDLSEMQCMSGENFQPLSLSTICPIRHGLVIGISILISMIGLCLGIMAALYYKFQQEIKVWLYAHNMCMWLVTEEDLDKDKQFDAFISYAHEDESFITDHLIPELELGPKPFKLCLHERHFIIGEFIPNQIIRCINESRRTVIILSPNFIKSVWAKLEFRTAHTAALNERRARVIIIYYSDIGNVDNLEPELRAYLQMNTYVKWGDPLFWDKLRYALPHRPNNLPERMDIDFELIDRHPNTKNLIHSNYEYSNGQLPNGHSNGDYTNHANDIKDI